MTGAVRTVVIVDDQSLVRAGLWMILDQEPGLEVVGEASDGRQAVDVVARTRPDVALMDIRMPVMDGIEATRRIAAADAGTRVLMLTTFGEDRQVVEALRAGASGFLLRMSTRRTCCTRSAWWPAVRPCSPRPSCAGLLSDSPRRRLAAAQSSTG